MSKKATAQQLKHYLESYSIKPDEDELNAILIYAAMLVGEVL